MIDPSTRNRHVTHFRSLITVLYFCFLYERVCFHVFMLFCRVMISKHGLMTWYQQNLGSYQKDWNYLSRILLQKFMELTSDLTFILQLHYLFFRTSKFQKIPKCRIQMITSWFATVRFLIKTFFYYRINFIYLMIRESG